MPEFSLGWKRQLPDPRDWLLRVPGEVTATLPPSFDLSAGLGIKLDQGSLGSCGPNSASELIEFDEKAESLGDSVASRLFIYWCTRDLMGTTGQDSGVNNRDMMKALNQFGFPPETLWPYSISQFATKPPQSVYDAAAPNKIMAYATVTQILDQMKGCLVLTGRPFVLGFEVFQQIMSQESAATGIIRNPAFLETPIGGHDISACGYNATGGDLPGELPQNKWPNGHVKARGHWKKGDGTPFGDNGYHYLPFEYALNVNLAGDFWCITSVPVPAPAPPPPGPPPNPPPQPAPPSQCRPVAKEVFRFVQNLAKHLGVEQ